MGSAVWSADLEVGLLWQDHQHKRFFVIRDQLARSSKLEDKRSFKLALLQLENYVQGHFSLEEIYMNQSNYPGSADHFKEHQIFIHKLNRAKREFKLYLKELAEEGYTGTNPWLDLSLDLEIWFVEHINGTDRRLANWIISHPVQPT